MRALSLTICAPPFSKPWSQGRPGPHGDNADNDLNKWWWNEYDAARKEQKGLLAQPASFTKYIGTFVKE